MLQLKYKKYNYRLRAATTNYVDNKLIWLSFPLFKFNNVIQFTNIMNLKILLLIYIHCLYTVGKKIQTCKLFFSFCKPIIK